MRVPLGHYVYFWLVNSLMATATGFVLGVMALRLGGAFILSPITFPMITFVVFQFMAISYFSGGRRGEFEYSFLEKSAVRGRQGDALAATLKEVRQELKMGDPAAAHAKLSAAKANFGSNFVVLFSYAVSCERLGSGDEAIAAYDLAETTSPSPSEALKGYIARQRARIKQKGPAGKNSAPGLQYVLY